MASKPNRHARLFAMRRLAALVGVLAMAGGMLSARVATSLVAHAAASPSLTFAAPVQVGTSPIYGISCPSRQLCVAVDASGDVVTSTDPAGGAAAWTAVNVDTAALNGVSCPSVTLCVAGDGVGKVLTSTNPTGGSAAWTAATVAKGAGLEGPSCPSVSFCAFTAAGAVDDILTSTDPTRAVSWKATAIDDQVGPVACPGPTLCVAFDSRGNVLTSINPTGGAHTWVSANVDPRSLWAMTCASASLCAAVDGQGNVLTTTNPRSGSASFWSIAAVDPGHQLDRISCPSTAPGFCIAFELPNTTTATPDVVSSTSPTAGAGAWAVQNLSIRLTAVGCADSAFCVLGDRTGEIAVGTGSAGAPAVTGIAPAQGPVVGGTSVALSGSGFSTAPGGTVVDFGAAAATAVTCPSTTSCTATAPAGAPGGVNVTATVAGATSPAGPANNYAYQASAPPPTITALAPPVGAAGGGTSVTVTGTGFDTTPGATTFVFGSNAATNVSCSSATTCVLTSPSGLGPQAVIATVAQRTSTASAASSFAFPPPGLDAISATNGSTTGGTTVTLTGSNFDTVAGTTQVMFGAVAATNVSCASPASCIATSPAVTGPGAVFVRVVEGPASTPPTAATNFTYVTPPVAAVTCGETITQSVTLTQDLGPCPGNGLVVTASGITVDLAGHRIFGAADGSDNRVGIELAGVTGDTVTGSASSAAVMGEVDGFASGVGIDGGSSNSVAQLDVTNNVGPLTTTANRGDGIVIGSVTASSQNVITNDVITHNGIFDGVGVFSAESTGNQILNNQITDNNVLNPPNMGTSTVDDGINLGFGLSGTNATTISGNTISRNGFNGIDACANGGSPCATTHNVITNNTIEANGTPSTPGYPGAPGLAINVSDYDANGKPTSNTFNTISGNTIRNNLGWGIFINNAGNTITNNVVTGNCLDPACVRQLNLGPLDLVDLNGCSGNRYSGNTFNVNEDFAACTGRKGTAI